MLRKYGHLIFILLIITFLFAGAQSPDKKGKSKKRREIEINTGPVDKNVFDRELVDDEPSPMDILKEHAAYYRDTGRRLFEGPTLGYVTPWNNHGYDVAKIWAKKFDMISPVWLQIRRNGTNSYEMHGTHDIDANWIKAVKRNGHSNLKIFPRVILDRFTETDFTKLLSYRSEQEAVNRLIVDTCRQYQFDGIVWEVWPQLAYRVKDEILYGLVIGLSKALKAYDLRLILVVPPHREEMRDLFNQDHFDTLYDHVHAFSLMTYDYSNLQRPGANAPLVWMKEAVEHICPKKLRDFRVKRGKILMGMNLYGNDYTPDGGGPIIGPKFLKLIKDFDKRLSLSENDMENFLELKNTSGRHYIFYPTLYSINERLKLAHELGVGISLWELGQGLDYFYDLF